MTVDIPPEFEQYVQSVIDSGKCQTESEVVGQALRLLQEIDERRRQLREEIEAGIQSDTIAGEVVFDELEQLAHQIASRNNEPA